MFYLIVKDPRRIPPERAALDQGIRSLAACPRTCCAAFSWSLGRLQRFKRIYRKYRNFGRLSMDFFHLFSAPCSTKFERSVPKPGRPKFALGAHGVLVGNIAQERNFLSPCNGLFALEGVSFATGLPA